MKTWKKWMALGTLSLGALGFSGVAQASDVYWSVGVSSPGISVGVGNVVPAVHVPPVYVQPAPVYVQPRPVVVHQPAYYTSKPPRYRAPHRVHRPSVRHAKPVVHHKPPRYKPRNHKPRSSKKPQHHRR